MLNKAVSGHHQHYIFSGGVVLITSSPGHDCLRRFNYVRRTD